MTRNPKKSITVASILIVVILLVGYTLFQAKNLIRGPVLLISEPRDGETVPYEVVAVKGTTENVSALTLNDSPIYIDKEGNFSEKIVASVGYSIVKLSAKDRFGTTITKYLHLILKGNQEQVNAENLTGTTTQATSTEPNSTSTKINKK
jgi:hypothetical protein